MAKGKELVALLVIFLRCIWSLDICEDQNDGAHILHPTDCSKYILCKFGETYAIENCNAGRHFNRLTSECDEPTEAACDIDIIKNLIIDSTECRSYRSACGCFSETDSTTPGISFSSTPDSSSSSSAFTTPASPTSGSTTPAESTPASPTPASPTPASTTPVSTTPASPIPSSPSSPIPTPVTISSCTNDLQICTGQPDYSSVYLPKTCSQYAICILGCANVLSCPYNLLYDLASHSCTYPQNVNCPYPHTAPTGPLAGPSGTSCEQHGKCANQPDGTLFADGASNGYIVCQCECEIARPCPGSLVFNDSLKVCDFP